jgi:hypothetical protein
MFYALVEWHMRQLATGHGSRRSARPWIAVKACRGLTTWQTVSPPNDANQNASGLASFRALLGGVQGAAIERVPGR